MRRVLAGPACWLAAALVLGWLAFCVAAGVGPWVPGGLRGAVIAFGGIGAAVTAWFGARSLVVLGDDALRVPLERSVPRGDVSAVALRRRRSGWRNESLVVLGVARGRAVTDVVLDGLQGTAGSRRVERQAAAIAAWADAPVSVDDRRPSRHAGPAPRRGLPS